MQIEIAPIAQAWESALAKKIETTLTAQHIRECELGVDDGHCRQHGGGADGRLDLVLL